MISYLYCLDGHVQNGEGVGAWRVVWGECRALRARTLLQESLLVDAFGERVHYMLVAVFQIKLFP